MERKGYVGGEDMITSDFKGKLICPECGCGVMITHIGVVCKKCGSETRYG